MFSQLMLCRLHICCARAARCAGSALEQVRKQRRHELLLSCVSRAGMQRTFRHIPPSSLSRKRPRLPSVLLSSTPSSCLRTGPLGLVLYFCRVTMTISSVPHCDSCHSLIVLSAATALVSAISRFPLLRTKMGSERGGKGYVGTRSPAISASECAVAWRGGRGDSDYDHCTRSRATTENRYFFERTVFRKNCSVHYVTSAQY